MGTRKLAMVVVTLKATESLNSVSQTLSGCLRTPPLYQMCQPVQGKEVEQVPLLLFLPPKARQVHFKIQYFLVHWEGPAKVLIHSRQGDLNISFSDLNLILKQYSKWIPQYWAQNSDMILWATSKLFFFLLVADKRKESGKKVTRTFVSKHDFCSFSLFQCFRDSQASWALGAKASSMIGSLLLFFLPFVGLLLPKNLSEIGEGFFLDQRLRHSNGHFVVFEWW